MQDFGLVRYVMKKNALLKKIAALFIATAVIFGIGTTSILRADEDPSVPELIDSGSGYSSIRSQCSGHDIRRFHLDRIIQRSHQI